MVSGAEAREGGDLHIRGYASNDEAIYVVDQRTIMIDEMHHAFETAVTGIQKATMRLDGTLAARVAAFSEPEILAAHGRVRAVVIAPVFRERKAYAATRLATILGGSARASPTPPRPERVLRVLRSLV